MPPNARPAPPSADAPARRTSAPLLSDVLWPSVASTGGATTEASSWHTGWYAQWQSGVVVYPGPGSGSIRADASVAVSAAAPNASADAARAEYLRFMIPPERG